MKYTVEQIQERIAKELPDGRVVPKHSAAGHFYEVDATGIYPDWRPVYPSVTGKLQILKDESLINYKKNKIIQWVYANWKRITDANIMELLAEAERVPEDILVDASDIGTQIHDTRERIFAEWIKTGVRPEDFLKFIDPAYPDVRAKSAIRALRRFCLDYEYCPIATELFVYSHALKVAGTLDDLGVMNKVIRPGTKSCLHEMIGGQCMFCDRKVKRIFVLMDLKSSNALKMSYWFQTALYYEMFKKILGIRPEMVFILKLSKENGTYQVEEVRNLNKMVSYAKHMLKTQEGIEFVKEGRKDNQKKVAEKIEL